MTTTGTTARRIRKKGRKAFSYHPVFEGIIKSGVIGLVVFSPLALGSVHSWAYTLIELSVVCLYIIWIVQFLAFNPQTKERRWNLEIIRTPLNIPFCLLIGVTFVQICPLPSWVIEFLSPATHKLYLSTLANSYESATRTLSIYPWASTQELYKLLTYVGIFYLVIYHFRERVWLSRLVKAMVITGFFVAVIGLLQHFAIPKMIYGFRDASYASPFGPYVNRNHFAGYIEMTIFVALGLLLSQSLKGQLPRGKWRSFLSRWEAMISKEVLIGFSVVVMAVALALSLSRGGIISSFVALAFMAGMMLVRRRRSYLTLLIVIFSFSLFYLLWLGIGPVVERLASIRYWETTIGYRPQVWQGAVDVTREFPLLGTGQGTFMHIYPMHQTIEAPVVIGHAENDYLEFFSNLGLIGGTIFWGGLFWFLIWVLNRWSERRHQYVLGVCLGSMTGAVSLFFHSAVDFNLHIPANTLLFFVLLAVGFNTVLLRAEGQDMEVLLPTQHREVPGRWRQLILFVVLTVLVIFGGAVTRSYLAERTLNGVREKTNLYTQGKLSSWVDGDTPYRLHRAKDLAPGYALPHYLLAKAFEQMALAQSEPEARAVFLRLAAREYTMAIQRQPTSAWYHVGLGWVYLVLSERDPSLRVCAKQELEIAARVAPKDPHIQRYLKEIYRSWAETP